MNQKPRPDEQSMFSQIDVSHTPTDPPQKVVQSHTGCGENEAVSLLREMLTAQDRQNELLEELVAQVGAQQRQRAAELGQWKQANPLLAKRCRAAAESLSQVQTEFLTTITEEVVENAEVLLDGEFMLNEFVDRFGPRLAHLNGVLQVLSQLSASPVPSNPR